MKGISLSVFFIFFSISLVCAQQEIVTDKFTSDTVGPLRRVNTINAGYGALKKTEVTGSITVLKSDEFNKGNVNSPIQLIMGKVAGLSIIKPGGDPNGVYDIRLRGLSTVSSDSRPLIVIDGVPGASPDNVDPGDIESITVLKDGSASAIYGTRGSNGVILITTRKGKAGIAVIDYNTYISLETVAKNIPVMNSKEWRSLSEETGLGTDFGYDTDWYNEIEQRAVSQAHNISVSGGTDKTNYRASLNYRNGEGVLRTSGYSLFNGRINMTQKILNDRVTLDMNLGATDKTSQYGFSDAYRYATIFNPTAPVKSNDPAYSGWDGYFNQIVFDYYNPVQILEANKNDGQDQILNVSIRSMFEIIKGLNIDAFYSLQSSTSSRSQYYDKNSFWIGSNTNGMTEKQADNSSIRLFETTARYNTDISSSMNISALGGYSYQDFTYEGFNVRSGNYLTDAFTYNNLSAALDFQNGKSTVDSYKNSNKLIAFFGRFNMNINSTWFITASARYDGSSRFGLNNKWGLFPALGGAVDLAKLLNISSINNLKLRAGFGFTGNQPNESYLSLPLLGPQGNSFYNGNFIPGYLSTSNANSDLKWEMKGEIDLGFDFSFRKSKLSGSFDFYTGTTSDLLFPYQVPVPPNLFSNALVNLGEIKNSGLELSLNWNVIQKADFSYSISFTPSYNLKNILVSLSGTYNGTELKYGVRDLSSIGSPGFSSSSLVRVEEGKPIGQLLAYTFREIDEDGNLIIADISGQEGVPDGYIDYYDRSVVGNGLPKVLFGFGNSLTYKNWDLNLFFHGVLGHDLLNSNRAFYEVPNIIYSYNPQKTAVNMRNATTGALLNNSSGRLTSIDIENASFVSLDNISSGYNFRLSDNLPVNKIRLYFAANNLFYITRYKGSDPNPRYGDNEYKYDPLVTGIDRRNTWPRTRSVTFGANVVF